MEQVIPQEILANIFEPYVTSKSHGTGLGLAIVLKIIDEHDGSITLKNNKKVWNHSTRKITIS